jgi:hypothetical protein
LSLIEIPAQTAKAPTSDARWEKFALGANPFPASGIAVGVDYDEHQKEQVKKINAWLIKSVLPDTDQWSPLAIKGSIGVGKTHVLKRMESTSIDFQKRERLGGAMLVTYHTLMGAGMKGLQLSSLLWEGLGNSGVVEITARAVAQDDGALAFLPAASPISPPLRKISLAKPAELNELVPLFETWLGRGQLSAPKLQALGITSRLEGEGQAIRAYAHLLRVARKAYGFRVWIFLLDQLEDLWRPDVTSALRRARFLTDLRGLVDESYEGAPIAVTAAWNTDVAGRGRLPAEDVGERIRRDYLALFTRLQSSIIEIPPIPRGHLLPFARQYVSEGSPKPANQAQEKKREGLLALLDKEFQQHVVPRVDSSARYADGSVVARALLDALRAWAEEKVGSRN